MNRRIKKKRADYKLYEDMRKTAFRLIERGPDKATPEQFRHFCGYVLRHYRTTNYCYASHHKILPSKAVYWYSGDCSPQGMWYGTDCYTARPKVKGSFKTIAMRIKHDKISN